MKIFDNKLRQLRNKLLGCSALLILSAGAQAVVFQAESYNAFNDTTTGNQGGAFRSDNVDIEATADSGGGYDVGWIETGEWLVYNNLSIPSTGSYTINIRVASPSGATASVDLNAGSTVLGDFAIPATGGWQNWVTVSKTVTLNAGTYNLGVFAKSAGWNFNWIEVVANGSSNVGPAGYTFCSSENQTCNFSGTRSIAYGANGKFNYRNATSSIACNNGTFGDPISSVAKACYVGGTVANLTFADEFDSINTNNWSFEQGGGGFGNNEREYYTNGQNASIQYDAQAGSNVLVIEARKDNPANYNCWYGRCEYTSSRMNTSGKKTFQYGRIEARMKLPQTQGIWPAFWMLGNDIGSVGWPQCGEIDIMEHVGFEPVTTHGAMHGPGYSGNTPFIGANYLNESVSNNYHVYAVEWNSTSVKYFVDGNNFYTVNKSQVQTYGNWVYDHPMFLILNVAVGGGWPGSPDGSSTFPQRMLVDYIRVYQ